jgi:hypothetical protein
MLKTPAAKVPTLVLLDEEARRIYDDESKSRGLSLSGFFRAHAREIVRLRGDSEGNVGIVLGVLLLIGLVAFGLAVLPGLIGPGEDRPSPWELEVLPSVDTTGGDTIPTGNYDSCDTEAGGTTAEWTATEGTYDPAAQRFTARVAIDTDLATTAALWMEPNCLQLSFLVRVVDAGDPEAEVTVVGYSLRIVSISRTVLAEDNASTSLGGVGFAKDGLAETGDWLLLYRTDATTWVAACPEYRTAQVLGGGCGFVRVGDHAGGAADTVLAVVILEDRGLWGYGTPAIGDRVEIVYEFGDPDGRLAPKQFTLTMTLNARGTANLS